MPRRATSLRTDRASKRKHLQNLKVKQELKKTLKKFQILPLEEQLKRKGEISSLIERENEIISHHWVNV